MSRAARRLNWGYVAVLLYAGCGDGAAPLAEDEDAPPGEPVTGDGQVWITTGLDSVDLVEQVLGTKARQRADAFAENGALVALRVPRSALETISEAQHELRQRCGGFVLHSSEGDALRALNATASGGSRNKKAPSYTVDNAATANALLQAVREENVLATIRHLSSYHSRFHTSQTSVEAVEWLLASWRELARSRPDITVELFSHASTPQRSVKMTMHGVSLGDEIVVVGGHLDSIGSRLTAPPTRDELPTLAALRAPGADDNASGIAVITEVARAAVELDYRPARSVVFYAYAAEEIGLVGSQEIAARASKEAQNIVGVMQLDMMNFNAAPEPYITFVRDETDPALNAFSIALIDTYLHLPHKFRECGYACSDHASWTRFGFPSTFPNEAAGSDRNPHAHTAEDTLELTHDSVAHSMHFARLGAAFVAELAKGQLGPAAGACTTDAGCATTERCESGSCVSPPRVDKPFEAPAEHDDGCGCSLTTVSGATGRSAALLAALLWARRRRSRKPR